MSAVLDPAESTAWLFLIHRVPATPDYLRVKIRRRLQRIGSVPLKSTVYLLPAREACREDFAWVAGEIREMGGEAIVCEGALLEGIGRDAVLRLFQDERDRDYAALAEEARSALTAAARSGDVLGRLRRRLEEIETLDFFAAEGRVAAEAALAALEREITLAREGGKESVMDVAATREKTPRAYRGRTWVTRPGVRVDRMASAWLIRRFLDPEAKFAFAADRSKPVAGQLRFDMFEAEFTHEGDKCTFEVLLDRLSVDDPALRAIGEVVHDLDLKDGKFGRPETAGIGRVIAGIASQGNADEQRLQLSQGLFDALYTSFGSAQPAAMPVKEKRS